VYKKQNEPHAGQQTGNKMKCRLKSSYKLLLSHGYMCT